MKWLLALLAVGCGHKDVAHSEESAGPGLARWMSSDAAARWQGSYVTWLPLRDSLRAEPVVLDIQGGGAKAFVAGGEVPLGFEVLSPCTAGFDQIVTEGRMAGATLTHIKQFAIENGRLIAGEGSVGIRKGRAAVACQYAGEVYTIDEAGTCLSWSTSDRSSKPASCHWSTTADGKDQLIAGRTVFVAEGDVLMDEQFRRHVDGGFHTRHPSYDAAKQALAVAAKHE